MGLKKYNTKREFDKTPEPKGAAESSRGALKFVVQKHHASRLHYDFRLEMEGVLKSWAVPKGPSLNPADKRLAMMTEDHPMEYRKFEGSIPEGNYGAGEVIVWDAGAYFAAAGEEVIKNRHEAEKILLKGLKQGKIDFALQGEKLSGIFSLVKLRGNRFGSKSENAWLLIKKHDEFASKKDITKETQSVLNKRKLSEDK